MGRLRRLFGQRQQSEDDRFLALAGEQFGGVDVRAARGHLHRQFGVLRLVGAQDLLTILGQGEATVFMRDHLPGQKARAIGVVRVVVCQDDVKDVILASSLEEAQHLASLVGKG